MVKQIPARDAQALKKASHDLIEKAGGVAHAATLTQSSVSRLSEAQSPWHENRWLSLASIADLECACEDPIIARALAGLAGYQLVPVAAHRPESFHQHLAQIIVSSGDVESHLAKALADGTITAAEAQHNLQAVDAAIDRLQRLKGDLRRVSGQGPAVSLAAVKS